MEKQAAEIITSYNGEIYEEYSGRGMFGKTTTGVKIENQEDFFNIIADILEDGDDEEREEVAKAMRKLKWDSLGLGLIFY